MPQSKDTGKLDKKPKPTGMLHPDPSHMQGYTNTQYKGMEEDLPSKWRAKKKQELKSWSLIKWTLNQQRTKEKKKGIT